MIKVVCYNYFFIYEMIDIINFYKSSVKLVLIVKYE